MNKVQRVPARQAVQFISDRVAFRTRTETGPRGGLWATDDRDVIAHGGTGQPPEECRADLFGAVYVVYSYATPIAWVTHAGQHVIPAVKYSPTTSQHQNAAGAAWPFAVATAVAA